MPDFKYISMVISALIAFYIAGIERKKDDNNSEETKKRHNQQIFIFAIVIMIINSISIYTTWKDDQTNNQNYINDTTRMSRLIKLEHIEHQKEKDRFISTIREFDSTNLKIITNANNITTNSLKLSNKEILEIQKSNLKIPNELYVFFGSHIILSKEDTEECFVEMQRLYNTNANSFIISRTGTISLSISDTAIIKNETLKKLHKVGSGSINYRIDFIDENKNIQATITPFSSYELSNWSQPSVIINREKYSSGYGIQYDFKTKKFMLTANNILSDVFITPYSKSLIDLIGFKKSIKCSIRVSIPVQRYVLSDLNLELPLLFIRIFTDKHQLKMLVNNSFTKTKINEYETYFTKENKWY